jgi:hypothetical protein
MSLKENKMSKHRIKISRRKLDRKIMLEMEKYVREILGHDPSILFSKMLYVTCFNDKCIIHEGREKYGNVTQLYAGRWIGLVIRGKPYLSPLIYEKIYSIKGYRASIVVSEKGVKALIVANPATATISPASASSISILSNYYIKSFIKPFY